MKRLMITGLIALAAAGCATAYGPRYERASGPQDVGYYDVRLEENRYRVQYRASESGYYAEDFAMRRAAEISLDRGYDWFQIVSRSRGVSDEFFTRYDRTRYGRDDDRYAGRPDYGSGYPDETVAVLDIVMGYNPPPGGGSVYIARDVLSARGRY